MSQWATTGQPCPCGQSSDAYAVNTAGWGTCFSCSRRFKPDGDAKDPSLPAPSRTPNGLLRDLEFRTLTKRAIDVEICRKFGYGHGRYKDQPVQVAPYFDSKGSLVAQKLRFADKRFMVLGDLKQARLFGQQLWRSGGKRLVITEGELDALAYAQATRGSWPVVSIPNGAAAARKAIIGQSEWVSSYDEVVLLFDSDEPGQRAAIECAEALPPGRAKIAKLPLKDAGEMLEAGRIKDLLVAVWEAQAYRPDGVRSVADIRDEALAPVERGLSWPWPTLTQLTHGIRTRELYGIGAGTGVGKTDVFTQIIAHLLFEHQERVGVIALEQSPADTVRRVAGKQAGKLFHVPDADWEPSELAEAVEKLAEDDRLVLYDHFGSLSWADVRPKIRFMVQSLGCRFIFLDHLTALAAAEADERTALERITAEMASLTKQLDCTLFFISHLATPEGKPHEEGGRVSIRHFKGSRAIGFWPNLLIGLERNQQADDPAERHLTTLRILKDRLTGQATGETFQLKYDANTGLLHETTDFDSDDSSHISLAYDAITATAGDF